MELYIFLNACERGENWQNLTILLDLMTYRACNDGGLAETNLLPWACDSLCFHCECWAMYSIALYTLTIQPKFISKVQHV